MTPDRDCYAVIFSSQRRSPENALLAETGYEEAAEQMLRLAAQQPGYLGVESARSGDGFGITVSYWESPQAIRAWKRVAEHQAVQSLGRSDWYRYYRVRIVRVERGYDFGTQD